MTLSTLLAVLISSPASTGTIELESTADSTQLSQLSDSILNNWMEEGHLLARLHLDASGNQIRWRIDAGPTLQWRSLASTGDNTYRPETLMRLGRIHRGTPATPSSLARAVSSIEAAGCTEVTLPAKWTGQRGTTWADAWLALREIPCSQADLAMGWDQLNGFQGQGSVTLANLLGTARSTSLRASSRNQQNFFSLDWHEPWIGDWDLSLDLHAHLQQSPTRQLQLGSLQSQWPANLGAWSLGLQAWSSLTNLTDTTFARSSAWGSRLGWSWTGTPRETWLRPERSTSFSISTLRTRGTPQPWLVQATLTSHWGLPFEHFSLAAQIDGQALLPLDSLSASGATRALGGASDWKGHGEGQFPTAQWIVSTLEGRIEAGGWGAAIFLAPGAAWIWRPDGPHPHPGYGAGIGLNWTRGPSRARLDLAIGEETRNWQDALLHLSLTNRF